VIGGARSGKSRYAQALAEGSGLQRVFVATAEALDDEMSERIARHRADRDASWRTREEPRELVRALAEEASPARVVLVDCLTLWLTNVWLAGEPIAERIAELKAAVGNLAGPAIFVSNEVGLGVAPATTLGRDFRDLQGRLNADLAATADVVISMTAGLPMLVKPAPAPRLQFF
jgi:adenosylcobinamide kinase/adenosylcobinamide-phosphate guanylyltransferase